MHSIGGTRHGGILGTHRAAVNRYNPKMSRPLPRSFFARDTVTVARELLGCVLACRAGDGTLLRGRIVETEAYVGEGDKACHARAGRTPRTDVLYGPPGYAYVYFTYGMHHLLNAVTEPAGRPAAVLIRAVEPIEGLDWMSRARTVRARGAHTRGIVAPHLLASGPALHLLASGPARLCQAFGLDLRHNRADLRGADLWIERGQSVPEARVATSPRIGCRTAPAPWDRMPWRYFERDSPFVTPGRSSRRKTRGGKLVRHRE